MKKNNIPFITVGSTSLLITFLILCLVIFSVLSLSSAVAGQKLENKSAKRTEEYYNASNQANDVLARVDQCLVEAYEKTKTKTAYYKEVKTSLGSVSGIDFSKNDDEALISWTTTINDSQVLFIQLTLPYPVHPGEHFYNITQWKVVNTEDWTPDQSQHVFQNDKKEGE